MKRWSAISVWVFGYFSILFLNTQEIILRLHTGFNALFFRLKKRDKADNKGETRQCNFKISTGEFSKPSRTIYARTEMD